MTVVNKRAKILRAFLLFLFISQSAHAANVFVYNEALTEAKRFISVLKLEPARQLLAIERLNNPGNAAIDYLENYIDFYTLVSSQDATLLEKLQPNKNRRLKGLENLSAGDPMKRYAQAEIELQWAFSNIVQHEFIAAAKGFRTAYKLLETNMQLFPEFTLNKKSMGMLKAVIGTIPDNYRWIAGIVGMQGNFTEGMDMLQAFLNETNSNKNHLLEIQSATYYYLLLQLNFGDKNLSWQFCETHTGDYTTNLLSAYLRSFTAIKTGRSMVAVNVLQQRPHGKDYIDFPILDYLEGVALLNNLNPQAAQYFKKYVSFSKGKNYIKDSYRRLAWHYLIHDNFAEYEQYKKMAVNYGVQVADEDKSAYRECQQSAMPDIPLLKARLLFDGGNYERALEVLAKHPFTEYKKAEHINEYYYRLARIYHENNNWRIAIGYYERAIETGAKLNTYYAPMSCLQLGLIYEKLNQREKALYYFEKVGSYRNYDYRSGITQKANAGISRLKR
jgi:hypothetical protein